MALTVAELAGGREDGELLADAALIERSWDSPAQFGVIYHRHAATIHRYLGRRVGVQLADDLTSQTFLVAFDGRRNFDVGHPSALPWLYGIATNLLHRYRRDEVRAYRALARTGVDPVAEDHAEQVVARVAATAVTAQLAEALARLPKRQRDVLLLVAWEGLEYEDVARALDIPVGTVGSRLHRARIAARAALGGASPTTNLEQNHDG